MASCWSVVGLLVLALAMIASLISFAAPFWVHQESPVTNTGLWGECGQVKDNDCEWFWQNNFSWESNRDLWWKSAQGLFAFGAATLIIAFFLVSTNMCCRCCDLHCMDRTVAFLLLMSFLEIIIALGLFGGYMNKLGTGLSGKHRFEWGFWIGICGAGLDLLALLIFLMNTCCRSRD